ncbi:MAG: DUF4493 domain-containing protein [Bacteroidaceae bacterium]|nr:DUF4493 domain-containing protein [Bacteroidaceae bacterium]
MNIAKTILAGTVLGFSLSACTSEDFSATDALQGSMSLNVDKLVPSATRAGEEVNPDEFPVAIYYLADNKEFESYNRADQVPTKIQMPVGEYYAVAHTPGELKKKMDKPYYTGRDEFEIIQGTNTESTVTCRMANGKFTVSFEADFANVFTQWTISIDDGTETAIIYTDKDGLQPTPMYLTYEENVDVLNVNFVGTTASGNKITASNKLTKKNASNQYDSDDEFFSGGDCIEINFAPVESTEGDITDITLKADIKFEESEKTFEMEVEDNITDNGGEEEGGDTPGGDNSGEGDDSAITLELPKNMTVTGDTDPSLGDTKITAENGIQSIIVRVTSTSEDMTGALAELGGTYEGIDFENGTEVVSNEGLESMFSDLNSPLNVPAAGEKEYVFPIGKFFSFLLLLPGDHTFILTVTDMNGNTKDGQLTLTIE